MPSGLQNYFIRTLKILIPATIALYVLACATIVSPTGGPKDITPPKMVSSEPKNLATNFTGNKLILTFDEYVQLKTPEKFLLISPPLRTLPDIKLKGHSVVVKLEDSLRSNTTYNFYFGEAIVDLTESNPIPNFNFAFSTGPDIDSLSLSGTVTDAFTRTPAKGVFVELYRDFTDSVPKKQLPEYVSRTSDKGNFHFNSLASGKYRAIALLDGDNNYIYNLPTETIGFSSDSVAPYYNAINLSDTVAVKKVDLNTQNLVSIVMFQEPDSTQRILKSTIVAKNRLSIIFRYPTKLPGFKALNIPDSLPWAIHEWNRTNDTLNAWLLNKPDTLKLQVSANGIVSDTVNISTAMKVTGKASKTEKATPLGFSPSLTNRLLGYNKPLLITFANPIKTYDFKAIVCKSIALKDTSKFTPVMQFTDSIKRHLLITYNWNATDKYDIYIPRATFTDIYDDKCDSTHIPFQMKAIEEYGKIAVTISRKDESFPVILQLLTDKGAVVEQRILTTEKRADFGLQAPGKYGIKAIFDRNANGRWDTGVFIKKIQPETVIIHPKIFDLKANWEEEETWEL